LDFKINNNRMKWNRMKRISSNTYQRLPLIFSTPSIIKYLNNGMKDLFYSTLFHSTLLYSAPLHSFRQSKQSLCILDPSPLIYCSSNWALWYHCWIVRERLTEFNKHIELRATTQLTFITTLLFKISRHY
jgi:hypothetical protein